MQEAALTRGRLITEMSFKGSLDLILIGVNLVITHS